MAETLVDRRTDRGGSRRRPRRRGRRRRRRSVRSCATSPAAASPASSSGSSWPGSAAALVMRLATILHEDTVGRVTENGAVIGAITFNGTLALITSAGSGSGLMAGVLWVIVRPWMPGHGTRPCGGHRPAGHGARDTGLDPADQPGLRHPGLRPVGRRDAPGSRRSRSGSRSPMVDGWLDRRLPHRPRRRRSRDDRATSSITFLGLVPDPAARGRDPARRLDYRAPVRAGWGSLVVGVCTLAWWVLRVRGRTAPPRALALAAAGARRDRRARRRDEPAAHPQRDGDALMIRSIAWVVATTLGLVVGRVRLPLPGQLRRPRDVDVSAAIFGVILGFMTGVLVGLIQWLALLLPRGRWTARPGDGHRDRRHPRRQRWRPEQHRPCRLSRS